MRPTAPLPHVVPMVLMALALAACGGPGLNRGAGGVYAPGVARGFGAGEEADPLETGHRLMAAGQYQLALEAFTRAAARQGINGDTLSGLGSANLRLGRLGPAETFLRRAVEEEPHFPPAWNNLGVLLMEQGKYGEAALTFQRAFAEDSGRTDTIRDNLQLALARMDDPAYTGINEAEEVRLVGFGTESPRPPEEVIDLRVVEPL